jgi:hypothetical protein
MRVLGVICCVTVALLSPLAALAQPSPKIAVFDFEFLDTSPAPPSDAEIARTKALGDQLRQALASSGSYTVVDIAPVEAVASAGVSIRNCNGCERDYAGKLGAKLAAYGWIQKVSNLILNINLVIEDVTTGKTLNSASVDIRGNTDESWNRGLKFLLDDRVFDQ